jgi:hypothetical protein
MGSSADRRARARAPRPQLALGAQLLDQHPAIFVRQRSSASVSTPPARLADSPDAPEHRTRWQRAQ